MITVSELVYEYPGLRALDRVGFRIDRGSITALVGPNGAGKTTLLRCVAGMDRPLAGSITVDGVNVVDEPRRAHRSLGYLSDFFGLYDDLTVARSLAYVAAANGIAPARVDDAVTRTAKALGLGDRLEQRTGELSRGLRQRVAIAQAIIHEPRVVLLDEPASGLDPEARFDLGRLFVSLRDRGMTLLVSSHILAELEAYSTHLLILREGRVVDHRPLAPAPGEAVAMHAATAGDAAALAAALAEDERVSDVSSSEDGCRFTFAGDETARAALLGSLVRGGLPVSAFGVESEDLQQSYLRTLAPAGEPRES